MTVPKAEWARILSDLAMEQDYTNFKNEVARIAQQTGSDYVHALHKVWGVMHDTQVN